MRDNFSIPESARQKGRRLACEGILRSQFGRRPSNTVNRAVEQLRREESDAVLIRFPLAARWPRPFIRPALALAACLALLIGLGVWLFPSTNNEPTIALAPGAIATVERGSELIVARDQMKCLPGDVLRVTGTNTARVGYGSEPTTVTIGISAEVKILAWAKGKRFDLRAGRLEASVARQRSFQPMVFVTPQAETRVLGTTFALTATTNATRLEVTEGKVKLTRKSDDLAVKVPAGYYAVAAAATELAALPITGSILREYWTNLPGDYYITFLTSHADYPDHPSGREYLDKFEGPSHWGTNYGARIRGYLHPLKTGEYTFWIAACDGGELWFSPDDKPENKRQIGYAKSSAPHEWTNHRGQQSSSITLVAGRKYYIEALHKQGKKDDHLAVAWQGPGREREVISGEFLSPFKPQAKEKKR